MLNKFVNRRKTMGKIAIYLNRIERHCNKCNVSKGPTYVYT